MFIKAYWIKKQLKNGNLDQEKWEIFHIKK